MSSIDPTSVLTSYLRGQFGQLSPLRAAAAADAIAAQRSKTSVRTAVGTARSSTSEVGPTREDLASTVARRVAAIDRTDPERRRKAFRAFLESLLIDEWGEQLINDAGFYQLVANVQIQMESDAQLRVLMDEAADRLLGPSPV